MTNFNKPFYFCNECKKVIHELDELLFVDEHSHKGFCSEECIEDFYLPLIKHYEITEYSLRKKLNLLEEKETEKNTDQEVIDEVLNGPSEVFKQENELGESYYHFIKHFSDFSVVVVASVYRKEASFVFLVTMTRSLSLVTEFRYGEMINDWNYKDEVDIENVEDDLESFKSRLTSPAEDEIDEEDEDLVFIQLLENKKSSTLAEIILKRKESDISFEDYDGYESCFQETLDQHDEVFEKKDKEGDIIFTYIKSYSNFFYIVICLKRKEDRENVNVYPILGLPTNDLELCQEFRGGIKLSGPLKN